MYYCDKLANFGTNTLLYIYCHLAALYLVEKNWPNDNKFNLGLCAFVPKFANNVMKPQLYIVCSSKNLIG